MNRGVQTSSRGLRPRPALLFARRLLSSYSRLIISARDCFPLSDQRPPCSQELLPGVRKRRVHALERWPPPTRWVVHVNKKGAKPNNLTCQSKLRNTSSPSVDSSGSSFKNAVTMLREVACVLQPAWRTLDGGAPYFGLTLAASRHLKSEQRKTLSRPPFADWAAPPKGLGSSCMARPTCEECSG
jgi:hypothetical protein